jgi:hypothetical protein
MDGSQVDVRAVSSVDERVDEKVEMTVALTAEWMVDDWAVD